MLAAKLSALLLLISGGVEARILPIARDSDAYQRYVGSKHKEPVPVEHLPYHYQAERDSHSRHAHGVNVTILHQVEDLVKQQMHEKNRTRQELMNEIRSIVEGEGGDAGGAKHANKTHESTHPRPQSKHHEVEGSQRDGHGNVAGQHESSTHDGHGEGHVPHETRSFHMASHETSGPHGNQDRGHQQHTVVHHTRSAVQHSSDSENSPHTSSSGRPYPGHHGVILRKREDSDDNIVYVDVTEWVTATVHPKETRTRFITSTIFVEAGIKTSQIEIETNAVEEKLTETVAGTGTVLVTPAAVHEMGSHSYQQGLGSTTSSESTQSALDPVTVTVTVTNTVFLEPTLESVKTASQAENQANSSDVNPATERHSSGQIETSTLAIEHGQTATRAEAVTEDLTGPQVTIPLPSEGEVVESSVKQHDESKEEAPEQVRRRAVRGSRADILEPAEECRGSSDHADTHLTEEQRFLRACNYRYGSDDYWDCHHRFFDVGNAHRG